MEPDEVSDQFKGKETSQLRPMVDRAGEYDYGSRGQRFLWYGNQLLPEEMIAAIEREKDRYWRSRIAEAWVRSEGGRRGFPL